MKEADEDAQALTPKESWRAIHTTMDSARSAMYVAGGATYSAPLGRDCRSGLSLNVRPPDARARSYDE